MESLIGLFRGLVIGLMALPASVGHPAGLLREDLNLRERILAISNHGSMLGGGEYSFVDLLSRLPQDWRALASVPEEGELSTRLHRRGIPTRILPLPTLRSWCAHQILGSIWNCYGLCRKGRPELIYANGSRAAFYGGITGRILGIPVIWHCRIADSDPYLDFILKRLSARIIANSRATAMRFREPFQGKVSVVYNGVDIDWLNENPASRPGLIGNGWKVILVVARVSRLKRHDLALTAFDKVAERDPNAHLVCVGSTDALQPDWWKHLRDRSLQSFYSRRIHWIGQVEDIRPWYRAAHTMLLPSDTESFGRVVVEAMACGVPVVATRCGGIPEIVQNEKDGLLVSPGKPGEMAEAVLKILGDGALRKRLASAAKRRAHTFSLDRHVQSMLQVFQDAAPSLRHSS